jgi:hypothetical protein
VNLLVVFARYNTLIVIVGEHGRALLYAVLTAASGVATAEAGGMRAVPTHSYSLMGCVRLSPRIPPRQLSG